MKIAIGYSPLESKKGIPYLGQNRQFQWAHDPWHAYPMVPAYAATMLKEAGHEIVWLDGIAGKQSYQEWLEEFKIEKPDLIVMETKTPVIKKHWKIIGEIKKLRNEEIKVVLVGDHVTALPEESFKNSKVDYVLTGGDYDFLLLNLVNHLSKKEKLEPGIWYRKKIQDTKYKIQNTGKFLLNHNLDQLPFIDRDLTKWKLYAYKNSNYCRTPGTFTMIGRDCWWRRPASQGGYGCTFCSWTTTFPQWRVGTPKQLLDEIGSLIGLGVREVFDDTGTFPIGSWLKEFCEGMITRGYNKKIKFGCNMRPNAIKDQKVYNLMGKAGFRFILYGLESANQKSLDRLNKGEKEGDIIKGTKMAKKAGLEPHVTCMVGYPWETKKQAQKTIDLSKWLFDQGYIDTLQATIVIPYPGTALFAEAEKNGWLKTKNWNRYDMREPVLKTPMRDEEVVALVRGIYSSFWAPKFVWRKLKEGLTSWDRFKYYLWFGLKYFSRGMDFRFQKRKQTSLTSKLVGFFWRVGRVVFGRLADFARK